MAHFAQLDENNFVQQVIVVNNNELFDENGVEQETKGVEFCQSLLGGIWKQTSYNARIRKNYAGIGYKYDSDRDAFIGPKLFDSWILNEDTCQWKAPVDIPAPQEGFFYVWNEQNQIWDSKEIN